MNDLDYIVRHLSLDERLAQLAEEAAELAQAALKYRRALYGANPTPVTREQAYDNLDEEVADVLTCLASVMQPDGMARFWIEWNMEVGKKAARWRRRLEEGGAEGRWRETCGMNWTCGRRTPSATRRRTSCALCTW